MVGYQLLLAAAASWEVWRLLGEEPTEQRLLVMAGLAGVVGGSLGPLLRPLPRSDAVDRSGTSLALSPLIYASGGFALSVGTYLVTRALLVSAGPKAISQVGVVAFAGVVGWIAAQIIDGVLARPAEWRPRRDRASSDERPAVVAALSELDERLFGRPLQNYDGWVVAAWYAPEPESTLGGTIRVRFVPRVGPEERPPTLSLEDDTSDRATATAHARVLVQGGLDVEESLFSLSVIHRGLETYPRRKLVRAPLSKPSEVIPFTAMAGGSPLELRADGDDEVAGREIPDVAIVEISQEGQTIQLLELTTGHSGEQES